MKAMKRILSMALAGLTVLALAACGGQAVPETTAAPETTTAAEVAATEAAGETTAETAEAGKHTVYPLTIQTYNYAKEPVEYTFEKAPERVWAQSQDNIEILLALGLGDKIVGAYGLDGEVREDLQAEFAKINYYDSMPSKEEIVALNPDFITGWYSTFSDKRLGDVDFWHARNIGTYMALNSGCQGKADQFPRTVENEYQDILTLGEIFDVQDKAEAIVADMKAQVKQIDDYLADKTKLTAAVLEDEGGTYRVYGADTLGGDVAIHGGAELAVGEHGQNDNIGAEDLILTNPDAIFMVWYDGYSVNDVDYAGEQVVELITENPAFASLDAVKNGRVYAINLSGIYCSGMRTIDGILDISTNLYPELYQ